LRAVWQIEDRKTWYLADVVRRQCEFPELLEITRALHREYRYDRILIEDASTGSSLHQILRRESLPVRLVKVQGDKVGRAYVQQCKFETGSVLFPQTHHS
jgi:predicted phage terminase large subunit-like protein